MKNLLLTACALTVLMGVTWPVCAHGGDGDASVENTRQQISEVRRATRRFHDVQEALAAGYAPFADKDGFCVSQPGAGGMGIHYLNGGLIDAKLDPLAPEALMYAPKSNGRLELVGVEYIVFQEAWDALHPQPPVLFGHPFHLVRAPNRYNVPAFYELHLWIWEHNPNGLFNDWNPLVRCSP